MKVTDEQVVDAARNYALFMAVYNVRRDANGWIVAMLKCDLKSGAMYRPVKDDIVAGPFGDKMEADIERSRYVMRAVLEAVP